MNILHDQTKPYLNGFLVIEGFRASLWYKLITTQQRRRITTASISSDARKANDCYNESPVYGFRIENECYVIMQI